MANNTDEIWCFFDQNFKFLNFRIFIFLKQQTVPFATFSSKFFLQPFPPITRHVEVREEWKQPPDFSPKCVIFSWWVLYKQQNCHFKQRKVIFKRNENEYIWVKFVIDHIYWNIVEHKKMSTLLPIFNTHFLRNFTHYKR